MLNPSTIDNPKIKLSPSSQVQIQQQQSLDPYDPPRQTVLMWGSTQQQQAGHHPSRSHNSTPVPTPPLPSGNNSTIRSPIGTPATTPTNGNGLYGGEFKTIRGGSRLTGNIMMAQNQAGGKWNSGSEEGIHSKHMYYETHPEVAHQSYLSLQQHQNQNLHHDSGKVNGAVSGEVWSPASNTEYHSQYHLTYHAPAHHYRHPSTQ